MEKKVLIKSCPNHPEYEGKQGIVVDEKMSKFNTRAGFRKAKLYAIEIEGKRIPGYATDQDITFI